MFKGTLNDDDLKELEASKTDDPNATTDGSTTDTSRYTTNDDSSDSEPRRNKHRKKKKVYKTRKELETVLLNHERMLKTIANQESNDKIKSMANTLSSTRIKKATQSQRSKTMNFKIPKLSPTDAPHNQMKDSTSVLRESWRTTIDEADCDEITDYLNVIANISETGKLSIQQYYSLVRIRIPQDGILMKIVRTNYRNEIPPKVFLKEIAAYHQPNANYLDKLEKFQKFNGKDHTKATELIKSIRYLATDLASAEGDPSSDNIYKKMREKLFGIVPTIAQEIMKHEAQTETTPSIANFITTCMTFSASIDRTLRYKRPHQVHHIEEQSDTELRMENTQRQTKRPSQLSIEEEFEQQLYIHSISDSAPTHPLLMKLTKPHIQQLANKCYKCGSESKLQPHPHRSFECLLYKGKALAAYLCKRCEKGVHLPTDCLQTPEDDEKLKERAQELKINFHGREILIIEQEEYDRQGN